MFVFIVLAYVQIILLFIVGAALATLSSATDGAINDALADANAMASQYGASSDDLAAASASVKSAKAAVNEFETLINVIIAQAVIAGLLNLATLVFLGRFVCCTDSFSARMSAVWGIRVHIGCVIFNILFMLVAWVAIYGVDFGSVTSLIIGSVVEIALWGWWHQSYVKHMKALDPASQGANVQVVKA